VSNLVIPNSFAAGTTISAYQMNSNFAAISSWANTNVDHSNIGSDGIYASQVIPASSAQATFGGSFGYTIAPGVAAQVPLTVAGTSFQTSDLFDVALTPGGTKALAVTAAGATTLLGPLSVLFSGGSAPSGLQAGDISASRSAVSGLLKIGGGTQSASIDFGVTAAGTLSFTESLGSPINFPSGSGINVFGSVAAISFSFPNNGANGLSINASNQAPSGGAIDGSIAIYRGGGVGYTLFVCNGNVWRAVPGV
jgi:hypothetical protein